MALANGDVAIALRNLKVQKQIIIISQNLSFDFHLDKADRLVLPVHAFLK